MKKIFFIAALFAANAYAVTIEQPLPDAAQEQRAQVIFHELKCVVCEGQALGESDAPLAHQMREEIRGMVADGKSEHDILSYFRERYGDRILLTPPVESATWLLWLWPLVMLGIGAGILNRMAKRRSK